MGLLRRRTSLGIGRSPGRPRVAINRSMMRRAWLDSKVESSGAVVGDGKEDRRGPDGDRVLDVVGTSVRRPLLSSE